MVGLSLLTKVKYAPVDAKITPRLVSTPSIQSLTRVVTSMRISLLRSVETTGMALTSREPLAGAVLYVRVDSAHAEGAV